MLLEMCTMIWSMVGVVAILALLNHMGVPPRSVGVAIRYLMYTLLGCLFVALLGVVSYWGWEASNEMRGEIALFIHALWKSSGISHVFHTDL